VRVARGGRVGVRVARPGWGARPGRGGAELGRDLAGEHPPDAETEQMRRVAAVGPGDDVAAGTRRAAWTAMAGGTAVGEPRADGQRRVHVAHAVADPRTLPLGPGELPLEQRAPPAARPDGLGAAGGKAGKGSRRTMKSDEFGVRRSPRPAPISSAKDLSIPSPRTLGACVQSMSWARAAVTASAQLTAMTSSQRIRKQRDAADPRSLVNGRAGLDIDSPLE